MSENDEAEKVTDEKKPTLLYRYFSADGAIKTLENGSLRFAYIHELNDPQECRVSYHEITPQEMEKVVKTKMFRKTFRTDFVQCVKKYGFKNAILHYCEKDKSLWERGVVYSALESLKDKFAICCFSADRDSPTMWGYYAHDIYQEKFIPCAGAVLEFDRKHLFVHSAQVRYEPQPVNYSFFHGMIEPFDILREVMICKAREWQHEQEYRIFIPKQVLDSSFFSEEDRELQLEQWISGNDGHVHLKFLSKVLRGIYIGVNTRPDIKKRIMELMSEERYRHVDVFQMEVPKVNSFYPIPNLVRDGIHE